MPKRIPWKEVALAVAEAEAEQVLDGLKAYDVGKSHTMSCTVCNFLPELHKMRYRLLVCSSKTCKNDSESARPDLACTWRGKQLTCLTTNNVSIYEFGTHASSTPSPPKKKTKLTASQKSFCKEMALHHLRPMRIRNALSRKFETPLENLPDLRVVQNFVNHYSRTHLENHDRLDELRDWIHARAYTGMEATDQAFTFGWELDLQGKPIVGNGSDENPFMVGFSTKALMSRMQIPPDSFILHIDGTYKTNQRGYPVVVVGISDRSRRFHLVALFIVSQETQPIFESVLLSLRRLFYCITEKVLAVRFVMADADQAQYNALYSVFGHTAGYQFLMCFFHVMKNVHKAIKGFPSLVKASIVRALYDLHFARCEFSYLQLLDRVLRSWMMDPFLFEFAVYMKQQWLSGRFVAWQAFRTPSGFATTNNPAETFNALLKRDYTLRRRLKMGALLREFSNCCHNLSTSTRSFSFDISTSTTLTRRVSEMIREKLICELYARTETTVYVASQLAKRVQVSPHKRSEDGIAVSAQMGVNYARMEVEGQPWHGWPVDIQKRWCPCNYCFSFGVCVHVLYALRTTAYVDSRGREVLVNRNNRKRGNPSPQIERGGRAALAGPALSYQ